MKRLLILILSLATVPEAHGAERSGGRVIPQVMISDKSLTGEMIPAPGAGPLITH